MRYMKQFLAVLSVCAAVAWSPLAAQRDTSFHAPTPTRVLTIASPDLGMRQAIGPVTPAPDATRNQLILTILMGAAIVGYTTRTITADKDSYPTGQSSRIAVNNAVQDLQYFMLHHPKWQVAAAAVAPPVLATATVTTQVKSTATTQLMLNGVLTSLTATDPLLLAANFAAGDPNTLAIGSVRRWQICWDGTNATTVITARPSNTKVIANYASAAAALADCTWGSLPPAGTAIVGVLSVANVTNVFTPGTTLLGAAGVTATYVDGPDQACFLSSQVLP